MVKASKNDVKQTMQDSKVEEYKAEEYKGEERRKNNTDSLAECLGKNLDTAANAFAKGAKRAERIVVMWMFAFILLAAYGFFLIFSLTNDVHRVANQMQEMNQSVSQLATNMSVITKTMNTQSTYMYEMVYHMRSMNSSMGQIRYDMSVMNNSVTRPMNFMNSFIPW